jgi:hypothetical protein
LQVLHLLTQYDTKRQVMTSVMAKKGGLDDLRVV